MAVQFGLIAYRQALSDGMSENQIRYRTRTGEWIRMLARVFRHAGSPRSWLQDVMAAHLWAGDDSFAFRQTAAALLCFDGFPQERPVEIAAPRRLISPADWIVTCEVEQPAGVDLAVCRRIPVTTPARTIFDLASVLDDESLEDALDWLLRHGQSLRRIRSTVDRAGKRGRRGTALIKRLLRERTPGYVPTQSVLEGKLARLISRSHLPRPLRQYVVSHDGKLVARPDFAYPDLRIAIEAVGYDPHGGRVRHQRDVERRNALIALGWIVLEFTWDDVVHRPEQVIDTIARAIASRI